MAQKNYTMQTAALKATTIDNALINCDTLNAETCNATNIVSDSISDSSGSAYLTKSVADGLYNNGASAELDPSIVVVTNSSGGLTSSTTSTTTLGYINNVTSDVQSQLNGKQSTITGAASTITDSNLTANMVMVTDSNGKATASSTISATELGYLDGVTSNVQTQLNAKQASVTGGATTITSSNLSTNRALISNGSGKVAVSAVTSTELGYLDGVTSNVQTQLNAKMSKDDKYIDYSSGTSPIDFYLVDGDGSQEATYTAPNDCCVMINSYLNSTDWTTETGVLFVYLNSTQVGAASRSLIRSRDYVSSQLFLKKGDVLKVQLTERLSTTSSLISVTVYSYPWG